MKRELHIGIVGAGGFAGFAAQAFCKVPGVRIAGVTDVYEPAARQLAQSFQAPVHAGLEGLLADPSVDLVYVATPPFLHYEQSKQALEAGKHVICEKPAALKTAQAGELAAYARSRQLLYTVNLMQRYNPLYDLVGMLIREKWLGDFLHGFFENYASDEKLTPVHWFWDELKSGGIFIEHGVHFFDMFSGWLGDGRLIHSMQLQRPGVEGSVVDRVQATVLYPEGPVTFYHGFNQPKLLDRQELRLQFDRGDVTLYEWVPVKIRLHGLLKNEQLDRLRELLPGASVTLHPGPGLIEGTVRGKFRTIESDVLATVEAGDIALKMDRYEQLVIDMIRDQWQWIADPAHLRKIDDRNAVESLRVAEEATERAERF
jgi:predicted dehydrogenase